MGAETDLRRVHAQHRHGSHEMTDLIANANPGNFARGEAFTQQQAPKGGDALRQLAVADAQILKDDCLVLWLARRHPLEGGVGREMLHVRRTSDRS